MEQFTKILVSDGCKICDAHKTELGVLLSIKESVEKHFNEYSFSDQIQLIISWLNNYKLDERTKFISQQKKDTTAQIQKYKEKNLETIHAR